MTDAPPTIRVVLADDHAIVRAGIRRFLEHTREIQVVAEADDGDQALVAIEATRPDVAVLDIQMPKLSGIEVAKVLRSQRASVGILILTAYDDDAYVTAVLRAGANGYILKTAAPMEIIGAVRDVYQGKSVLDSCILSKVIGLVADDTRVSSGPLMTDRELEVLALTGRGLTNKAIGAQLKISDRTVQGHLARVFEKLQVTSRTEAVMRAVSQGWLPADLGAQISPNEL